MPEPKDPQFVEAKRALDELIVHARGLYIHRCVELEMYINLYLAVYFCNTMELQNTLISHLLGTRHITLDSKIDIFCDVLKKDDPVKFDSKDAMKTNLKKIIEFRNIFAHYHVDYSQGKLPQPGLITFIKWKGDKTSSISYTPEEFNAELAKVYEWTHFIGELVMDKMPTPSEDAGS